MRGWGGGEGWIGRDGVGRIGVYAGEGWSGEGWVGGWNKRIYHYETLPFPSTCKWIFMQEVGGKHTHLCGQGMRPKPC